MSDHIDHEAEAAWAHNLRVELAELTGHLATADRSVSVATRSVNVLTGTLYDIELVEGHDESDLRHELATAARALRNAARIVEARVALYEDEQAKAAANG